MTKILMMTLASQLRKIAKHHIHHHKMNIIQISGSELAEIFSSEEF